MAFFKTEATALLYLISCVVNGKKPDPERIKKEDFEALYALSKRHFVTAICYHAINSAYDGKLPHTELFAKWKQDRDLIFRKMVLFDVEYDRVAKYLEENDVWHMRMKGAEIQKFYPSPEMREMSDVDILFDESRYEIVKKFFLDNGYVMEEETPSHYEFLKKPVYNFEMHKLLFSPWKQPELYEYYNTIKEKLVLKDGSSCTYLFKPEDQYVFYFAHEYKHYSSCGIGIRSLIDCYLMKTKAPEDFGWEYVFREMEKLKIKEFYDSIIELASAVFSDTDVLDLDSLSSVTNMELDKLIRSGVYGNSQNAVKNKMASISKGKKLSNTSVKLIYVIRRIFPDRAFYQEHYTELVEKKCPLVFIWFYRLIKGLRNKEGKISKEIRFLKKNDFQ